MTAERLREMLADAGGGKKDGSKFRFPDDGATLYLSTGGSLWTIERVAAVELKAAHLVARTHKDEQYHVLIEGVVGVRVDARRDVGPAGFVA